MDPVRATPDTETIFSIMQTYNENMNQFLMYCRFMQQRRGIQRRAWRTNNTNNTNTQEIPGVTEFSFEIPLTQTQTGTRIRHLVEATNVYSYHAPNHATEEVCPISHTEFREGDIVCTVRDCGHTFKYASLMTWLDNNVTCPVCRLSLVPPTNTQLVSNPTGTETMANLLRAFFPDNNTTDLSMSFVL